MTALSARRFRAAVRLMDGAKCWSVIAGRGTGSDVTIDFGQKIAWATPLTNDTLTESQRRFYGEISIYVTCAWRIDSPTKVICGSGDWDDSMERMLSGLHKLVGGTVVGATVSRPAADLSLKFDRGLTLRVFCDQTSTQLEQANYSILTLADVFTVGPSGQLVRTKRVVL